MSLLVNVVVMVQILTALAMIGLVLVQHGKGADMGASFGSGASGSLFGATGSANFLSRTTAVCAAVFFVCTLALAYIGTNRPAATGSSGSVLDRAPVTAPAPAASGAAQIPTGTVPAPTAASATAPAPVASGAAAIPNK